MRFLFVLALLLAGAAQAGIVKQSFTFRGQGRTYYLDVPDSVKGPAPVLVLLHGSGGNGGFMAGLWKDLAEREGVILIAPDSLRTDKGWDLHSDGPDYVHDAIAAVAAAHPVDFRRLYVFGQSGGAVYALTLAMLESEYFAAVTFHAGGWRRPAEYAALDFARRRIPIAFYVGDLDEYFPLASVRNTERLLRDAGFPAELTVLPGRHHSLQDVPEGFLDTVWTFLKGHALSDVPRYADYGNRRAEDASTDP